MHTRVFASRNGIATRVWSLLAVVTAIAVGATADWAAGQTGQAAPTYAAADAAPQGSSLRIVLEEGIQLEQNERWGEAVSHYDDALRLYPDNGDLRQRQDLAKLHYSIERRYDNRSFLESLQSLPPQHSTNMYSELLRRIEADYVESPPWQRLGSRSLRSLQLALADEDFQAVNGIASRRGHVPAAQQALGQVAARRRVTGAHELAALANDAARLLQQRLGLRPSAVYLEFVSAAAGGLDEYSGYLTADQFQDISSQIEGSFVGLGVELKADNGALLIVRVIPGSPAEKAGIRNGDRVVAVDGRSTAELSTDRAADMLTGEPGTYVRVTIESPIESVQTGAMAAAQLNGALQGVVTAPRTREVTVRREHVEVPSLEDVGMVDAAGGVAYVRIPSFQKSTARDLDAALWKLHEQGMRSLIIDVRGNPGGLMPAAFEVADKFLMEGKVFSTRGRNRQENFTYRANYGGTWRVPLVVLIDGDSASASEIFAGAIKDNSRGEIIGQRSYGKGTVQGIFPLGYGGVGLRLTTAYFYSPNDQIINKRGIEPTQIVHTAARPVSTQVSTLKVVTDEDAVLTAGIAAARQVAAPLAQN